MSTSALPLVLSFIFGTIIGSFLNVVALRHNTGTGLNGRSKCMSCGKSLTWIELIPIFSFLIQKGACRKCRSKISWQYPLVEFAAGAIFVLIFFKFPPVSILAALTTLFYLVATCLLLAITVYDMKHKIIPDPFVYAFDALALVSIFIGGASWFHAPHFATLLAGPLLALPFALIWLASSGRWMGLGDAKLTFGLGWFLGLNGGANALVWAFWIGAAASIIWMFMKNGKFQKKTEIPFGPYLILGFYLVLLFGFQAIDLRVLASIF